MLKTRAQNVASATWSPNGEALGTVDLTKDDNNPFGTQVFSPAVQKELPPEGRLREAAGDSRARRGARRLAGRRRRGCDEGVGAERGATHFTHVFQPLTGLTAEKHDSFFEPNRDGMWLSKFSGGQGADPGRARRLLVPRPAASARPSRPAATPPGTRRASAFILENPNGAPSASQPRSSLTGGGARRQDPLLRSMDALSQSAIRALRLLGDDHAKRVFTTVGPEQKYFLIDENYFYDRPDLVITGRALFGAKPAKGHELDDHYWRDPRARSRLHHGLREQLAKLGAPIKTPPTRWRSRSTRSPRCSRTRTSAPITSSHHAGDERWPASTGWSASCTRSPSPA